MQADTQAGNNVGNPHLHPEENGGGEMRNSKRGRQVQNEKIAGM